MIVGERAQQRLKVLSSLMMMAAAVAQARTALTSPVAAALAPVATSPPPAAAAEPPFHGDPQRGKALYANCTSCHSIDDNDIGPMHRGVVGRKAGTAPGYAYSAALKASGIVWNPGNLDRWLTNPSAMVPGTKMFFLVPDPQVRSDIIAYLTELK
jgi:cytochrome c